MEKKSYLIMFLAAVLILSGGIYAYTYTTALRTIGVTDPTGDVATVEATATQPDWDTVLTPETDSIIYRPNAAGDETAITEQFPDSGEHWDKVDEVTSDNDTTYVQTDQVWREDLFNLPNHSTQTAGGTINYVEAYMVAKTMVTPIETTGYTHIQTNGTEYNGTSENLTLSYAAYSYQWSNNPETTTPWTWNEIDALQIGVGLRKPESNQYSRGTQVYTKVSFDAPPLSGYTPTEDLFEITPDSNYSGDLLVRVYLANTGALVKAYQSLNLELYLEGSVEAGKTPSYRTLTIENGVATFNLVGIAGGSYTLSVTGGTYTLTSREVMEWEAGYTVTPELYCEVTQR